MEPGKDTRIFDLFDNLVETIEGARRACRAAVESDTDFIGAENVRSASTMALV